MSRADEIRKRLAAATPGPWRHPVNDIEEVGTDFRGNPQMFNGHTRCESAADAELIANAPDDLAWCLDEIERLTKELADETQSADVFEKARDEWMRMYSALKAQAEALTKERMDATVKAKQMSMMWEKDYEALKAQLAEAIELVKEHGFDAFDNRPKKVAAFLERVK